MAIEGIRQEIIAPRSVFNRSDSAEVSAEALRMLGLVEDIDQAVESINADYDKLTQLGIKGRSHIDIPYSTITTFDLVRAVDTITSGPETYIDDLWVPGKKPSSYTDQQQAKSSGKLIQARLAIYSNHVEDPLLHFVEKEKNERDQDKAIKEAKRDFEVSHPQYSMKALGHRAFLLMCLEDRIRGISTPLQWGYMRDANLPKTTDGRYSLFGAVNSRESQLYMRRKGIFSSSRVGVGLSVGQAQES